MTPFHKLIKEALLAPCQEATRTQREPSSSKSPAIARLEKYLQSMEHTHNEPALQMLAGAIGAFAGEEVKYCRGKKGLIIRPLSVCKSEERLYIVTHPQPMFLDMNGNEFRLGGKKSDLTWASDEEVDKCLTELTPRQQSAIAKLDVFKPHVAPIFLTEDQEEEMSSGAAMIAGSIPGPGSWRDAQGKLLVGFCKTPDEELRAGFGKW